MRQKFNQFAIIKQGRSVRPLLFLLNNHPVVVHISICGRISHVGRPNAVAYGVPSRNSAHGVPGTSTSHFWDSWNIQLPNL